MPQKWRTALRKLAPVFFSFDELHAIEAKVASHPGSEIEDMANSEEHPLKLARSLKYLLKSAQETDVEWPNKFDKRLINAWKQEMQLSRDESFFPEYITEAAPAPMDISTMHEWVPLENNLYSLGREGAERVMRIHATLTDIGLQDFASFWASNKSKILSAIPLADLEQRATLESTESYSRQQKFLTSLATAIASARGLIVDIQQGVKGAEDAVYEGGYYRKPDSFIRIGDSWGAIEQKTKGKIAEARGQVVVLGNLLIRRKSPYVPRNLLRNEMYGFVGDGFQLQCLRQVHAYKEKVKAFDGPLLALAPGDIAAGELFTVDVNSDAVVWAAAVLDQMVVTEAMKLQAAAEVSNDHRNLDDYEQLKLMAARGYAIGDDFLALAGSSASAPAPGDDLMVTVLGAARNNNRGVVLRVMWNSEIWWLKMGPEVETRHKALQALDDESPAGEWERWFQTERDMLSRSLLSSSEAFAVVVEAAGARNRPAMLVKDAGDSLEKRLLASQKMEPAQVYEMSKQLCSVLESCCKEGVVHGDVCLENICEKNGSYSLIDWGLAGCRPFEELAAAVEKAWPAVDHTPGIPNWEMSADCCFLGMRPNRVEHDLESLLYCCMKLLGGNTLPWSDVAASGTELDVLNVRTATVRSFVKAHERYIYRPLLLKLGLVFAQEVKEKEKPGSIPGSEPHASEAHNFGVE